MKNALGEIKDAIQSIMRIAEALMDALNDPTTEHEQAVRELMKKARENQKLDARAHAGDGEGAGKELEGDEARTAISRAFDAMKRADDDKRDPDPTGPVDVPAGVKAHPMAVGSSPQGDGAAR